MVVRMSRALPVALAALLAGAPACSDSGSDDDAPADGTDDGDTADDGAGDDGGDDAADDDGADDGGDDSTGDGVFTVEWGPITVPAGEEDTRCVRLHLPTDRPIRVGQIENALGLSSHHLIVYRLADGIETTEPEPCAPFVEVLDPAAGSPMAVTQRAEELIQLPPGVAFTLEAGQMIRMELHYINATEEPQELRATTTFFEMPEAEFEQEADFLFIGNPEIDLPAAPPAPEEPDIVTLGPSFLPLPAELGDVNVFAITGHQHHWGTDVQVSLATGAEDEGIPVYAPENFQWDEPETTYHDPPLTIPAGGGFQFSCSWQNFSNESVGFGESVNDEMCFFWAYYYPSRGARICFHTDELGGGVDLCCPSEDPLQNTICQYVRTFLDGD